MPVDKKWKLKRLLTESDEGLLDLCATQGKSHIARVYLISIILNLEPKRVLDLYVETCRDDLKEFGDD